MAAEKSTKPKRKASSTKPAAEGTFLRHLGDPRYEPANLLIDDRYFDNLSGQQAYKCFACRVRKA